MRIPLLFAFISMLGSVAAQNTDSLNTAEHCAYMLPEEKEMIREINLVRHQPATYLAIIQPLLSKAQEDLARFGKGEKNFSLTYSTRMKNGKETKRTDTTFHYEQEELVKALTTLTALLSTMQPRSILQPDSGIYLAAQFHAADEKTHQWRLLHTGSDGKDPWDRIRRFSPKMVLGNENIAGRYPAGTPREMVIQLLIDSGIPGYGHRTNLLDPKWTHVACVSAGKHASMYRWIQNFGMYRE